MQEIRFCPEDMIGEEWKGEEALKGNPGAHYSAWILRDENEYFLTTML